MGDAQRYLIGAVAFIAVCMRMGLIPDVAVADLGRAASFDLVNTAKGPGVSQ